MLLVDTQTLNRVHNGVLVCTYALRNPHTNMYVCVCVCVFVFGVCVCMCVCVCVVYM